MKRIALAVVLLILFFPILARANDNDKEITDQINIKVTQLASLLQDYFAREHPEYRTIKIIRNNHDNSIFATVTFLIAGFGFGNNEFTYLAVFDNDGAEVENGKPEELPKTMRLVDFIMVDGSRYVKEKQIKIEREDKFGHSFLITFPTLESGPNDPNCCPSIKSKVQFRLDRYDRLQKIEPKVSKKNKKK